MVPIHAEQLIQPEVLHMLQSLELMVRRLGHLKSTRNIFFRTSQDFTLFVWARSGQPGGIGSTSLHSTEGG